MTCWRPATTWTTKWPCCSATRCTWNGGYLVRQAPVLPADKPGLARKVKPFCRLYERETAAYALVRGIEYIYDECPFAEGSTSIAHKEILNQMEKDSPGTKLQFYLNFLARPRRRAVCRTGHTRRTERLRKVRPAHQRARPVRVLPSVGKTFVGRHPYAAGGLCATSTLISSWPCS